MQFFDALQRVANQANAHRKDVERLTVSPHMLRHTFLRKLAEEKGVQYARKPPAIVPIGISGDT